MNAFISSQFSYCPLIWMCHSRSLNTKINKTYERALRIVYNDSSSSFQVLLQNSGQVKTHHRNLQQFAVEIYKPLNNLSSSLMSELFNVRDIGYALRGGSKLISNTVKTVNYRIETPILPPRIWALVPDEIKNSCSLNTFKHKIKIWVPKSCPCRICKIYIPNLGFLGSIHFHLFIFSIYYFMFCIFIYVYI